MTRKVKCRFCGWDTPVWTTSKAGRRKSGMTRLVKHVEDQHPEKYEEVQRWLGKAA